MGRMFDEKMRHFHCIGGWKALVNSVCVEALTLTNHILCVLKILTIRLMTLKMPFILPHLFLTWKELIPMMLFPVFHMKKDLLCSFIWNVLWVTMVGLPILIMH